MTNSIGWNLTHRYANDLPALFYTKQRPVPVENPELVKLNEPLASELGLDAQALATYGVLELSGNELPDGADPLAQGYAGHQFGHFTMLGDGRAILLGEQVTPDGKRYDIQLKGAGKTPYSRGGDGRAALGPMLREYIISEAMHGLRIPTSRSLAVVVTGEPVYRETVEMGAILTRVAQSHLRVGTFQYAANWGTKEDLTALVHYALQQHYTVPEAADERPLQLLREVMKRQASTIAKWQLVGFIHGVMNTDNMTISGETIDYGPCAFMDTYAQQTVFSSIDVRGRYAYGNQPPIAAWNITRFVESLLPILHEDEAEAVKLAEAEIARFPEMFRSEWNRGMRAKLGLRDEAAGDDQLFQDLLNEMQQVEADYTNTFRALTLSEPVEPALAASDAYQAWFVRWQKRLAAQHEPAHVVEQRMREHNPNLIPRNHLVEKALSAAVEGDLSVTDELLAALADPYAYTAGQQRFTAPPPKSDVPYQTFCGT